MCILLLSDYGGGNHMEKMLKFFKIFFEKSLLMELGKEPIYDLREEETKELLEYIETF